MVYLPYRLNNLMGRYFKIRLYRLGSILFDVSHRSRLKFASKFQRHSTIVRTPIGEVFCGAFFQKSDSPKARVLRILRILASPRLSSLTLLSTS